MCTREKAIQVFEMLDVDGSGKVTKRELVDGLQAITGDRTTALDIAVDVLKEDRDNDGLIDKEEFLAALKE